MGWVKVRDHARSNSKVIGIIVIIVTAIVTWEYCALRGMYDDSRHDLEVFKHNQLRRNVMMIEKVNKLEDLINDHINPQVKECKKYCKGGE